MDSWWLGIRTLPSGYLARRGKWLYVLPHFPSRFLHHSTCSFRLWKEDWKAFTNCADNYIEQGEAELNLIDFAEKNAGFESFIARPAFVLPKDGGLKNVVMGVLPSVKIDALAAVLLDASMHGGELQTLENADLVRRGRELAKP